MNKVDDGITHAEVRTGKSFPLVWLVPVLAVLVGGWLAYSAYSTRGPQIVIHFDSADGLVAEKTKVKFNALSVGVVEEIRLNEDLSGVEVVARLDNQMKDFLRSGSRFWVEKARIDFGKVSGLQTLLGGAYISMSPSGQGVKTRDFIGLEKPPALESDVPGTLYHLRSETLSSLTVGSPVFYRKIRVGQIVDYQLAEDGSAVNIDLFVRAPYNKLVKSDSRFWNASGVSMRLDAEGVQIQTESLTSILNGGVAFETPVDLDDGGVVSEEYVFYLYPNQKAASKKVYTEKIYLVMYFPQSVRGLKAGAPVEMYGLQIGHVVDIQMFLDSDDLEIKVPVLVVLEPERLRIVTGGKDADIEQFYQQHPQFRDQDTPLLKALVEKGLRARLKTGNLLTGQLYVSLGIVKNAEEAHLAVGAEYPVFPTVGSSLDLIAENISRLVSKLNNLPLEDVVTGLSGGLKELQETLVDVRTVLRRVDTAVLPELTTTLKSLDDTLTGLNQFIGPESDLDSKTRQVLMELTSTVRSLRGLTESLDNKPESLIFGKGEDK